MAAWDIQGRDALSTTGVATGGLQDSGWSQGDFVYSREAAATSGNRTAPAGGGLTLTQLAMGGAALLLGVLLWRRLSK